MKYTDLTSVRHQLDQIDSQILALIAQRCELMKEIAAIKKQQQLAIRDSNREDALLAKLGQLAIHHQVNPLFIQQIFTLIIEESVQLQQDLLQVNTESSHC